MNTIVWRQAFNIQRDCNIYYSFFFSNPAVVNLSYNNLLIKISTVINYKAIKRY